MQTDGGIAQLGERLNGIQEVSGSIPLISTKGCLYEHPTIYFVGVAFVLAMPLPKKR